MQGLINRLRVPLWLCLGAALTFWVWRVVQDVLGSLLISVPVALAFAGLSWLSGPPYRHPPNRWKIRLRGVPGDARAKMKYLGRIVLGRIEKEELPGKRFAFFRWLALFSALLVIAVAGLLVHVKQQFTADLLADMQAVVKYNPTVTTRVRSSDGQEICSFNTINRVRVPISRVPETVRQAFIAAEDGEFRSHAGIRPVAMLRAYLANRREPGKLQGASTITQQVVKMVILRNRERTYRRKVQEVLLAVEMERLLPKDQILEIYLDHLYLGHNAYGIGAAARTYFGKEVENLNLAEAAILAGLAPAPSEYSPTANAELANRRKVYVLDRMAEDGYIDEAQKVAAMRQDVAIVVHEDPINYVVAPYFCDLVRRELTQLYGKDAVFSGGLDVTTTLDMRMQRAAEDAVRRGLLDLERRIGWSGPEGHDDEHGGACEGGAERVPDGAIDMASIASMDPLAVCVRGNVFPVHPEDAARIRAWEAAAHRTVAIGDRLSVSVVTEIASSDEADTPIRHAITARRTGGQNVPEALQASLVSVDPRTGELRAFVGGFDFRENQFNNATMALRQPGSSIKPYVYLTALMGTEKTPGLTVDARLVDEPRCYQTPSKEWCPNNYDGEFRGEVDLRTALAQSLNSVSVQLARRYGVGNVIRAMQSLGITSSSLKPVLPLAVGAAGVSPWEHTYAYASIAAGGREIPRHPGAKSAGVFIAKVKTGDGRVLYAHPSLPRETWPQAVPAADAYALTHLMRGVVEEGTGRRVRELRRPAAGKTGTTNDNYDVWFMGFTTDLVTGVWVGRQTPSPIADKATGGSVALPIWLAYMRAAEEGFPPTEFPVPDGVWLMPNAAGTLVPYQRQRVPERLLGRPVSTPFSGQSPF